MDQSLRDAAQQGSIDALYAVIRTDAKVLDRIDEIPFVDTPLHTAAFAGHTQFAKEIMRLKPSFAKKLNQDGLTPIHLALQKHHDSQNDDALQRNLTQLVYRLLNVDKDLVRVQGREGVTPLHYAAQIGNLDLLALCIKVCPESLEDVTIRGENVLHITLKNYKVEAFMLVIKWAWQTWLIRDALKEKLVYGQDEEGNTFLHVAVSNVSKNLPKAVSWLVDRGLVDLNVKNLNDQTVFDILEDQTKKVNDILKDETKKVKEFDKWMSLRIIKNKIRQRPLRRLTSFERQYVQMLRFHTNITDARLNALLVVGALLITVTFQAALTPPKSARNLFLLFNALAYILTTSTLFSLIPRDLIGMVLYALLLLLFVCFCFSTLVITSHHIIFIVLSVLFGYSFSSLFYFYVLLPFVVKRDIPVEEFLKEIDQPSSPLPSNECEENRSTLESISLE